MATSRQQRPRISGRIFQVVRSDPGFDGKGRFIRIDAVADGGSDVHITMRRDHPVAQAARKDARIRIVIEE